MRLEYSKARDWLLTLFQYDKLSFKIMRMLTLFFKISYTTE